MPATMGWKVVSAAVTFAFIWILSAFPAAPEARAAEACRESVTTVVPKSSVGMGSVFSMASEGFKVSKMPRFQLQDYLNSGPRAYDNKRGDLRNIVRENRVRLACLDKQVRMWGQVRAACAAGGKWSKDPASRRSCCLNASASVKPAALSNKYLQKWEGRNPITLAASTIGGSEAEFQKSYNQFMEVNASLNPSCDNARLWNEERLAVLAGAASKLYYSELYPWQRLASWNALLWKLGEDCKNKQGKVSEWKACLLERAKFFGAVQ